MIEQLCRIMIGREKRMLDLAKENFSLEDLLNIKSRMIGTGLHRRQVRGHASGAKYPAAKTIASTGRGPLEPHDSFYIGSDVFYTYIVENGWWKLRMEQKTRQGYFDVAQQLREKMLSGIFPEEIKEQFQQMIEYFGQSPIIVRSSSLLEDAFGNVFAGKYESIFLRQPGHPEERYERFDGRGAPDLRQHHERGRARLPPAAGPRPAGRADGPSVQRVSGSTRSTTSFPTWRAWAFPTTPFVWKKGMDPKAGMLRLVLGLGTRAVNRVEGDYPRIVAPMPPLARSRTGVRGAPPLRPARCRSCSTPKDEQRSTP